MADTWNPAQYERFVQQRSQPFYDLLSLVRPSRGGRVVDLGCGTGHLTVILHERLRARETLGLDSSERMLASAPGSRPESVTFRQADIAAFDEAGWDVIFSNAALHWLPDHTRLFERLARLLAPEGQLAIQMPANDDHPSHAVAAALAAEEPFASAMGHYRREWPVLAPEAYARMLFDAGFAEQHVHLQVYPHVLESRDEVVEWVRGTLLTDYQKRLTPDLFDTFIAEYRRRLAGALPDERPFFYPFKRILLWAKAA